MVLQLIESSKLSELEQLKNWAAKLTAIENRVRMRHEKTPMP